MVKCVGLEERDLRGVVGERGTELGTEFKDLWRWRPAEPSSPFQLSQKQEYLCLRSSSGSGLGCTMLSCSDWVTLEGTQAKKQQKKRRECRKDLEKKYTSQRERSTVQRCQTSYHSHSHKSPITIHRQGILCMIKEDKQRENCSVTKPNQAAYGGNRVICRSWYQGYSNLLWCLNWLQADSKVAFQMQIYYTRCTSATHYILLYSV